MLLGCIEYTSLEYIPQPYYVTGHGEISDNSSNVCYLLSNNGFAYDSLDLPNASAIPENANCLIINAPSSDFTPNEAKLVIDYLKNGGALTLITNEANLDMPNLMSIVNAYGVSAEKGIVSLDREVTEAEGTETEETGDSNNESAVSEETENTESTESTEDTENTENVETEETVDKHLVDVVINSSHDAIYSLEGYSASVLNGNHINISDDLGKSVIVTKLMTTAAEAYIDGIENSSGEKTLAVAIEEETANGVTEIAWFTGADSYEGEETGMVNVYAAAYAVLWSAEDYVSQVRNVEQKLLNDPVVEFTSGAKLSLSVIFIGIIPLAVLVYGFVVYNKRKKIMPASN